MIEFFLHTIQWMIAIAFGAAVATVFLKGWWLAMKFERDAAHKVLEGQPAKGQCQTCKAKAEHWIFTELGYLQLCDSCADEVLNG